ncbi:MAG: IPT/TIG domain-containing protein [Candidatus Eremiobacteraeota bacterium]|nr:IPT/TIG domain-containing protein [Candidatus Eremiobacteraeota bacterium]
MKKRYADIHGLLIVALVCALFHCGCGGGGGSSAPSGYYNNDTNNNPTPTSAPTVTNCSLSGQSVAPGAACSLSGTGFGLTNTGTRVTYASYVELVPGTATASTIRVPDSNIVSWSDTYITFLIPSSVVNGVTYTISVVKVLDGSSSSSGASSSASVTPAQPTVTPQITGILPAGQAAGQSVTITGTNFGTSGYVTFGTTKQMTVTFTGGTQAVCAIPSGMSGAVSVSLFSNQNGASAGYSYTAGGGSTAAENWSGTWTSTQDTTKSGAFTMALNWNAEKTSATGTCTATGTPYSSGTVTVSRGSGKALSGTAILGEETVQFTGTYNSDETQLSCTYTATWPGGSDAGTLSLAKSSSPATKHSVSGAIRSNKDPHPPLSGVSCTLTDVNGAVRTTTTDASGNYSFTEVPEGTGNILLSTAEYLPMRLYFSLTSRDLTGFDCDMGKISEMQQEPHFDLTKGLLCGFVWDKSSHYMGGVAVSSSPSALSTGYSAAGTYTTIDWSATQTVAITYESPQFWMTMTPDVSSVITAAKAGVSFAPSSWTIMPRAGELALVYFMESGGSSEGGEKWSGTWTSTKYSSTSGTFTLDITWDGQNTSASGTCTLTGSMFGNTGTVTATRQGNSLSMTLKVGSATMLCTGTYAESETSVSGTFTGSDEGTFTMSKQ